MPENEGLLFITIQYGEKLPCALGSLEILNLQSIKNLLANG